MLPKRSDVYATEFSSGNDDVSPINGDISNGAAIDNKIEQAMDLVKTHLLYAVRGEVEVLKERILELEARINFLETENKQLRKYASSEILQSIQQILQEQEQAMLAVSTREPQSRHHQ